MPHMIQFAAPPMLSRRLRSDIEAAFPDHRLAPPGTHLEMFEAAIGYGQSPQTTPVLTISAYPQLLNRVMEDGAAVAPLSGLDLPPVRSELVRAGLSIPHPGVALIAAVPLVLAINRKQASDVKGWDDLRPFVEEGGRVATPPDDTPLPYLLSSFLAAQWGKSEIEIRARFDCQSPPQEINKRLGRGEAAIGLLPPAFCRNAREGAIELVWPVDGPLVAPIVAVMSPGAPPETGAVLRALLSAEYQRVFSDLGAMIPVIDGIPEPLEMTEAGWVLQQTRWPAFLDVGRIMTSQLLGNADGS